MTSRRILLVGAASLLLVILVAVLLLEPATDSAPVVKPDRTAAPGGSAAAAPERSERIVAANEGDAASQLPEEDEAVLAAALDVRVLWADDRSPIADVGVIVERAGGASSRQELLRSLTNASGLVRLESIAPGEVILRADRGGRQAAPARARWSSFRRASTGAQANDQVSSRAALGPPCHRCGDLAE